MERQVVIDANLALALAIRLPYSETVHQRMESWQSENVELIAPVLWEYECVSGLRRAATLGLITAQEAETLVDELLGLEINCIAPSSDLHKKALGWAAEIGQAKAYDAQYLALAEEFHAEFWSADRRLVNAVGDKCDWVHWIDE